MKRIGATLLLLLAFPGPTLADEAAREEAHRTVLRRLSVSGKAGTAKLGLSDAGRAFVDLHLDLERNRDEIRRGKAPRSARFSGVPHAVIEVTGEVLRFRVCFVQLVIDEVSLPLAEVPAVIDAALDPERFRAARIPTDDLAKLDAWRASLIALLVTRCGDRLAGEAWEKTRARLAKALLASLDSTPPREIRNMLSCLASVGGEDVARALIERIGKLPAETPGWVRAVHVSAICGMEGKAARAFLGRTLAEGSEQDRAAAIGGLRAEPDDEIFATVAGLLPADSGAPAGLRSAAISALERWGGDRARKTLEGAFATAEGDAKYGIACSLTRMGSDAAVPWLEALLAELEKKQDGASRMKAGYLRGLLSDRK